MPSTRKGQAPDTQNFATFMLAVPMLFSTCMLGVALLLTAKAPLPDTILTSATAPHVTPEAVLSKLKSVREWKHWTDTFSIEVDGDVQVGSQLQIKSNWGDLAYGQSTKGPEFVTHWDEHLQPPKMCGKLCWTYNLLPEVLLTSDRCIEVCAADDDSTNIINRIQFLGLFGPLVDYTMGPRVKALFEHFNADLVASFESGKKKEPSS